MLRTSKYHWTDKEKCAFLKKKNWDHFGLILDQNVFVQQQPILYTCLENKINYKYLAYILDKKVM